MEYQEAVDAVRNYGLQMLEDVGSNLTAVAVGRKDGGPIAGATEFSVVGFVKEKLTNNQLSSVGAKSFADVYGTMTGSQPADPKFDLDVVVSGSDFSPISGLSVHAAQRGLHGGNPPSLNAQKPFKTLRVGVGITNPEKSYPSRLSVGTLGFCMRDDTGVEYLVSNNHVIGRNNAALKGEMVVQPGTLDLTSTELALMPHLADLSTIQVGEIEAVVNFGFRSPAGTPNNRVDAAIARLGANTPRGDLDRLTYGGCILAVADPFELDAQSRLSGSSRVYKVGRTTGYTEGNVTHIFGTTTVKYGTQRAHFVDQIFIKPTSDNVGPFSASGDSGSGILNDRHELVGLLFAGSANQTVANKISNVVAEIRTAAGIPSLQVITA